MPKLHLYFHTPVPVFKARVNMASATYPVSSITFDNVTLGSYTDIDFDSTILIGSSEGADDLGRTRVQKPASSTAIPIMRSSRGIEDGQVDITDNAYITVLDDFRVWARLPYFDTDTGVDYKDGDVEVTDEDYNVNLPPIANCGSGFADYIDPDTSVITVEFPNEGVNLSRAMADGATITTYAWDVQDGTITVGTAADDVITATFPAGFRYVGLTVTDSNGIPHSARCPVLAIDPADDATTKNYQVTQRLEWRGQTLDVNIHNELDRAAYPDGTLVMFWWDSPTDPGDRSHMKFVGWVDNESYGIGRTKRGVAKTTTLHCVDVCGRLAVLPGFPQALFRQAEEDAEGNPALPWGHMPSLDMNKCLWYLAFWHSTAVNLADFILPADGDSYDAMRLDTGGASLFEQLSGMAQKMVPDHYLTCNAKGQIVFQKDWRLVNVGDRPTAAPIIQETDWNDIQIEYNRHPKVHVLRSGAIQSSTAFVTVDDEETLPLVFSIAPSDASAFGQGVQEQVENEGLALSQEDLNESEGHRYAMLNSRYGDFTFRDPTGADFWDYEPAAFNRVQVNIPAAYAAQRGLDFTQGVGIVKSISVNYQTDKRGTVVIPSVVWNKEVSGYAALTHTPEDVGGIDYVAPITTPPDFGLEPAQESVAALDEDGTLYRTTDFQTVSGSGGPTWTQHSLGITDNKVYSFVVDPFSPGYVNGSGSIDGWCVTESDIYRIEDMFGTPSATSVHTFATAIDHTDTRQARTIQASFGAYFALGDNPWLLVISHYGDETGHEGTWALRSLDAGVTWETEVQITEFYDSEAEANSPATDIAVHTSPKVPGLAYTSAFIETGGMPQTAGFVSEDWGETWTQMERDWDGIPDEYVPHFGYMNTSDTFGGFAKGYAGYSFQVISDNAGNISTDYQYIILLPHPDTKRVLIEGDWIETRICLNGTIFGVSYGGALDSDHPVGFDVTRVNLFKNTAPATNGGSLFEEFSVDWTRHVSETEWPENYDDAVASTPTDHTLYPYLEMRAIAGATLGRKAIEQFSMQLWAAEVEMEDTTVYTSLPPKVQTGHRLTPAMNVPWLSNDDDTDIFSTKILQGSGWFHTLFKAVAGSVTDITPTSYAPGRSGFGIRSYDSDRDYMVMGGVDADGSSDMASASHAVLVSDDGGATWTSVLGPTAGSSFTGKDGYSAAFSGTDPNILYIWGAPDGVDGCIAYSDDFGVTIDSREGNLGSFGISSFLGIAGGPA